MNGKGSVALLAGATLLAAPPSLTADTPEPGTGGGPPLIQLDPFDVVAHPTGADERTASVWVVAADADLPPPIRTSELLQQVPGLHVDRAGGPGGRSTLYVRGMEENHTLVLLDGIPLNDPTNSRGGGVDVSTIDPSLLRTVAVVRGPASVRHGPEAPGGVAHLETGGGAPAPALLGVEAGGDGFRRAYADASWAVRGDARLSLGFSAMDDGAGGEDGRSRLRFVRAAFAPGTSFESRVALWHGEHEAYSFPDDSGGMRLAVIRELEQREESRTGLAFRAGGEAGGGAWTATFDAARFAVELDNPGVAPGLRDPAGLPPLRSDSRLDRFRASLASDRILTGGILGFGIDAQHEHGSDDGQINLGFAVLPTRFDLDRTRAGVFAEGTLELGGGVLATVGGRMDRFTGAGDLTRGTGRLGLLGPLGRSGSHWRLNAGTAFKPPSFYAMGHPLVGNPELAPERAQTAEAGIRHVFSENRGIIDFTVFQTQTDDTVDFDPGPPPRLVNRDGVRSRGAELAWKWGADDRLSLSGALSYIDARAQPGGDRMRSRPRWRGTLGVVWTPQPALTLHGQVVAVGEIPDTSIATGDVEIGGWARVDFAATYRLGAKVALTVAVDNLFDRAYEEIVGFPAQARRVRAGVQVTF